MINFGQELSKEDDISKNNLKLFFKYCKKVLKSSNILKHNHYFHENLFSKIIKFIPFPSENNEIPKNIVLDTLLIQMPIVVSLNNCIFFPLEFMKLLKNILQKI